VIVKNGRAAGVALENGDEIYADVVVSSLDPNLTFLKLVDPGQLPEDLVQGQPGPGRGAGAGLHARQGAAPARRNLHQPQRGLY
jgi:hypothetical protein